MGCNRHLLSGFTASNLSHLEICHHPRYWHHQLRFLWLPCRRRGDREYANFRHMPSTYLLMSNHFSDPFGYDKNDLNMDHFTRNIIRNELRALTAFPPPSPDVWAFSPRNDRLFNRVRMMDPAASSDGVGLGVGSSVAESGPVGPAEWVQRGPHAILDALSKAV